MLYSICGNTVAYIVVLTAEVYGCLLRSKSHHVQWGLISVKCYRIVV